MAAKVLKPIGTYEKVRALAEAEFGKLEVLRHPNITYVYDAFEFRDTFYIITERCYCPLTRLFSLKDFNGLAWLTPIARSLLQAVHYIHLNQYAHQDIHPGNVFAAFAKDEMCPRDPGAIQFKLGDLGVAKLFGELDLANTRADWMLPPEAIDPSSSGRLPTKLISITSDSSFYSLPTRMNYDFLGTKYSLAGPREMALDGTYPLMVSSWRRRFVGM